MHGRIARRHWQPRYDCIACPGRAAHKVLHLSPTATLEHPGADKALAAPASTSSNEQPPISSIHQRVASPDGTADAVAQMIAGIVPVGLDTSVAEECRSDVAMCRPCQRAVERTERKTHTAMSRLDRKIPGRKLSLDVKMIETSKRVEPLRRQSDRKYGVRQQPGRLKQATLGQRQLQMMPFLLQEHVLIAPRPFHQDDRPTGQCAEIHALGGSRRDCSHWQHMGALAGRPEDECFRAS